MPHFFGFDPRGFAIVFPEDVWTVHAEKHHEELRHDATIAHRALANPSFILPNPSNVRLQRTGQERYCLLEPSLRKHVVVPTRTLTTPEVFGGTEVPEGARVALTVHVSETRPPGRPIWVNKP